MVLHEHRTCHYRVLVPLELGHGPVPHADGTILQREQEFVQVVGHTVHGVWTVPSCVHEIVRDERALLLVKISGNGFVDLKGHTMNNYRQHKCNQYHNLGQVFCTKIWYDSESLYQNLVRIFYTIKRRKATPLASSQRLDTPKNSRETYIYSLYSRFPVDFRGISGPFQVICPSILQYHTAKAYLRDCSLYGCIDGDLGCYFGVIMYVLLLILIGLY